MVTRLPWAQENGGSTPPAPTNFSSMSPEVRRLFREQEMISSTLICSTIFRPVGVVVTFLAVYQKTGVQFSYRSPF